MRVVIIIKNIRDSRSLLRVWRKLLGVRLLHDYTLARIIDVKCPWTKPLVIRVEVKLIIVKSLELS